MVTKKQIIAAAAKSTGVNEEYIELIKGDGYWCWAGKSGSYFDECATFQRLNDATLQRWADDFKYKVERALEGSPQGSFNELIESINWDVE